MTYPLVDKLPISSVARWDGKDKKPETVYISLVSFIYMKYRAMIMIYTMMTLTKVAAALKTFDIFRDNIY